MLRRFPTGARALSRRLRRALRRHGLVGAVHQAPRRLRRNLERRYATRSGREFDRSYGVETQQIVHLDEREVGSANIRHAAPYDPVDPERLRRTLAALPVDPARFTFVDMGSGKGRAMIVASEFPFREVVGVEFSPGLHAAAERNLEVMARERRRSGPIVSVLADAADYPYPPGSLVLHLYAPFEGPVLHSVLRRACEHTRDEAIDVLLVFTGIVPREVSDHPEAFAPVELETERSGTDGEHVLGHAFRPTAAAPDYELGHTRVEAGGAPRGYPAPISGVASAAVAGPDPS